ncbi:MAG: DUF2500 domain-containing protein [Propionicimonas sp.]
MGDDFGGFGAFDTMFNLIFGLVVVGFVVILGVMVAGVVRSARQGIKNNAAPEVTAQARVVDKRIEISGGGTTHSGPTMSSDGTFTSAGMSTSSPVHEEHYVTFEQAGGERFELKVPASEYGLLVVGDQGAVTMKGTRYLGFQRELMR